jgi:peptidoglycan/LPS O-acetylase OafA/YrhL
MIVIIFVRLGFHLNVPLSDFVKQCIRWFSLGILNAGDFKGYPDTWRLLAGVTWSLRFEWFFYFGLPLLALATRSATMHLPIAAGALTVSLIYAAIYPPAPWPPVEILPALFLVGMTCGSLARNRVIAPLADPVASAICGLLICGVFLASEFEGSSYRDGPAILLGGAFYLIASGCSFFGVLTSRPARRLGHVSYGIYLLQGLVLTLAFSVGGVSTLVLTGPLGYWCMVLCCAALLVVVATLSHVGVERTGIELGKRLSQAIRNSRDRKQHRKLPIS